MPAWQLTQVTQLESPRNPTGHPPALGLQWPSAMPRSEPSRKPSPAKHAEGIPSRDPGADASEAPSGLDAFWRRLLHRWLVQYNPIYLLSAALVLGGMTLLSRGFAERGSVFGELGVAAIAEVYAFALIGGAALLTRIQLRRPGVMLALLVVLYQGDLTLQTETSAYLGGAGIVASAVWAIVFGFKLRVLAWAVRLRLSRTAFAVAMFGALGVTVIPHLMVRADAHTSGSVITIWLFALAVSALWSDREVTSTVSLDAWGRTVMRRALRASWIIWAVLLLFHVGFWLREAALALPLGVPMAALLSTRWVRREGFVWLIVGVAMWVTAVTAPESFSLLACMVAVVLGLNALRQPVTLRVAKTRYHRSGPYRTPVDEDTPRPCRVRHSFTRAEPATLLRLLSGSVFALYLSVWTIGWSGGAWPAHLLALDGLLTVAVALLVWKGRMRLVLVPLAATYFHLAVQAQLVSAPTTVLQWGATCVGLGFALLAASLVGSVLLRRLERREATAPP